VEQLVLGKRALLPRLPDPEPSSLPHALRRGSSWILDPETGVIVSSYYGRRYQLHVDESGSMRKNTLDRTAKVAETTRSGGEGPDGS
jgi:hypothetical protein